MDLPEEQSGLVEDIFGDLSDNLGRIRSHGERANRIVHDMLQMGRDAGGVQATDINNLLTSTPAWPTTAPGPPTPISSLTCGRTSIRRWDSSKSSPRRWAGSS